jgi:N-acetyl-anhydromuramyl-L-alanine amidase AmpD
VAVGYGSLYGWFLRSPANPKTGPLSTHYWVGQDGTIEQYVPDTGASYGQGVTSAGSAFPPEYPGSGVAYNQMALSIEREGYPTEEATPIQWQRIVELNRWLAHTYHVPMDGDHIVGHYRTDRSSRSGCPSTPSLTAAAYMAKLVDALLA